MTDQTDMNTFKKDYRDLEDKWYWFTENPYKEPNIDLPYPSNYNWRASRNGKPTCTIHSIGRVYQPKSIDEFNKVVDDYIEAINKRFPDGINKAILTKSNNLSQSNIRHLPAHITVKVGNLLKYMYIDSQQLFIMQYSVHNEDNNAETKEEACILTRKYFAQAFKLIPKTEEYEFKDEDFFTCPENPNSMYYNYCNEDYMNRVIGFTYSLDRNSAFVASMVKIFPQVADIMNKYYKERIKRPKGDIFRDIGSIFIGMLKKDHLTAWKAIVSESNREIHRLRLELADRGYQILLVNTDAVKFSAINNVSYKTSTELGEYKFEWQKANMYIKGVKSYAYVKDGKWEFKQAGKSKLDMVKKRSEWTLTDYINGPTELIKKIAIAKDRVHIYEYFE